MSRKTFFYSVFAVAMLLLCTEVLLRGVLGLGSPPLLQTDDDIGYLFQPNQEVVRFGNEVKINQYHQRSDDPDTNRGAIRALFIGDSVTWGGVLVDQFETYPSLVEQLLADFCAETVQVLNASAGSWGIGNQTAYLARFGTFDSQVVVLQIGSHDLLQATATDEAVGVHPSAPEVAPRLALEELAVRYIWPRLRSMLGHTLLPTRVHAQEGGDAQHEHPWFRRNMDMLTEAIALIRSEAAEPMILYTPDRNEVVPENSEYATTYDPYRGDFYALADSLSVPVVNLKARWRGDDEAERYFRDGVHFSVDGNRAAAQAMRDALQRSSFGNACQ